MSLPGGVTDGVREACGSSCAEETGRQLSLSASASENDVAGSLSKRTARTTYQLLGLAEGVLHVGEAEAGHGDELAHHRHKLVSQLLRPLLLVVKLLNTGERGEGLQPRRKEAGKVLRFVSGICVTHTFHTLQAAAQVVDVFFQLSHARKTAQFVKLNEKAGT